MGEAKKHHYVPQAYLRFFAQQEKTGYLVYVFDKKSRTQYPANIMNVAEERNYNKVKPERFSIDTPTGDALYYEKKYTALIEGRIPQIIGNIVSACTLCKLDKPILTPLMKQELAKLIVIQLLRTPTARHFTYTVGKPVCDNVLNGVQRQIRGLSDIELKGQFLKTIGGFEYTEEFAKSVHLSVTTDENRIDKFSEFLVNNRAWVIFENKLYKSIPFVTSDNPVVLTNLSTGSIGIGGSNGLDVPSTVISMPLTPRYSVFLYHKACVFGHYSQSYEDKCIPINEEKFIFSQDIIQVRQCIRQIYTPLCKNSVLKKFKEDDLNE